MFFLINVFLLSLWLMVSSLRKPAFLFIGAFLLWQFFLKIASATYLKYFGPIYSDEVHSYVGGENSNLYFLLFFIFICLLCIYMSVRLLYSSRVRIVSELNIFKLFRFSTLLYILLYIICISLYLNLFVRGNIPLFNGLERFEFDGGPLHSLYLEYFFMIFFSNGYILARKKIIYKDWDYNCIIIFLLLMFYFFLTGHRFSAFYVGSCFFLLPVASLFVFSYKGYKLKRDIPKNNIFYKFFQSKYFLGSIFFVLLLFVLLAIFNNLVFVRNYGDEAQDELLQRLLVQPIHLYFLTIERFFDGSINGDDAIHFMFTSPIDSTRNTGIQYLMYVNLGYDEAYRIISAGSQYAGGFPEILLELGGAKIAILISIFLSIITGLLYYLCIISVCRGRFFTSILSVYVLYGFLVFYVGGMLNFLFVWTFWLKCLLLFCSISYDSLEKKVLNCK
jgi:hypothetical protein